MAKHRLTESIKSFFESHIDSEKDEELKGMKFDIDSKVEKILELIREDNQLPLPKLIEDFQKQYHMLYARYDDLTGKLKNKAHSEPEKESSSSSSSSESEAEYSSKKKGKKNGRVDSGLEIAELKRILTATTEENHFLENKLQETETLLKNVKVVSEKLEEEKSKFLADIQDLGLKLENVSKVEAQLNQKLEDTAREKDNLMVERKNDTRKMEEGEKIVEGLRSTADQLINERENIKLELEVVKQQLESAKEEVKDLSLAHKTAKEDNDSLASKIIEISIEIKQAQDTIQELTAKNEINENEALSKIKGLEALVKSLELELNSLNKQKREMEEKIENLATVAKQLDEENLGLQDRVSMLDMTSNEKKDEIANLLKKNEDNENISSSKIEELTAVINNLQLELDSLHIQNGALEELMVRKGDEATAQVKELVDQITLRQEELDALHSRKNESELHIETKTREVSEHLLQIEILKANQQRLLEEKEGSIDQVKKVEEELDSLFKQKGEMEEKIEDSATVVKQLEEENLGLQNWVSKLDLTSKERENEIATLVRKNEDNENISSFKIQELTALINKLQLEVDSLQFEKGELEKLMVRKGDEATAQVKDLVDQITQMQEELDSLHSRKTESEMHVETKTREISEHLLQIEILKADQQRLLEGKEVFIEQVEKLEEELDSLFKEKREMEVKIENTTTVAKQLEEKNLGLQDHVSKLDIASKEKEDEIFTLVRKIEDNENISTSKIQELTALINNLQLEVGSLHIEKGELEEQMVRKGDEATSQVKELVGQITLMQEELDSLHSKKIESELHIENKTREVSEHFIQIEILKADKQRLLEEKVAFIEEVKRLEEELDPLFNQKSKLEEKLRSKDTEISALQKKYEDADSETSVSIMNLTDHIRNMQAQVNSLQSQKGELEELLTCKSNEASDQIRDLIDKVNVMEQELGSLHTQNSESESELIRRNEEISEYVIQIENFKEHVASKRREHQSVLENNEGLSVQVKDLEVELQSLHSQICDLGVEKEGLKDKTLDLEKTLIEKSGELFAFQKKHELEGNQSSSQIVALKEKINDLQQELYSLQTQKSETELHMERQKQEFSESMGKAENQRIELLSKIEAQQRKIEKLEEVFEELTEEHKQVQNSFQECNENLHHAKRTMEEMDEDFRKNISFKDHMASDLEKMVDDLKGDLEAKADEHASLVENVRNIEVKLRLSNQKLRVTEQLLTEKEESHRTVEKQFQEEHILLEKKISTLSGIISSNNKSHQKLIFSLSENIQNTINELEVVGKKFEEDNGYYENRVHEVTEVLRMAKIWVKRVNHETDKLKKEVYDLFEELKEKKDHESLLREKVKRLELKVSEEEVEKEKIKKKMLLYEVMVKEKDEGMLGLGEEKREVIRQLCLSIDYHRSSNDYLKEVLSKMPAFRTRRVN